MSIILTITAVIVIFSKGSKGASFLDPASLREAIEKLPESDRRKSALSLVGSLEHLAKNYGEAAQANIARYVDRATKWNSNADILMQVRKPMDQLRMQTLKSIVRLRQSMLDTLTPEEWKKVFGKPPKGSSGAD
jgi:hypothetical protein